MKKLTIALTMLMLGTLLPLALPTLSLAQGPNIECPAGSLAAKFEWNKDESTYEFEKGNEDVVTIDSGANAQGGSWTSEVSIFYVIIKGATETVIYDYVYDYEPNGETGGSFSASDFPSPHTGKDISNVQFCSGVTAITLVSFSAKVGDGDVTLAWETGTELDNAGFNLYRATAEEGPYAKINDRLIAAQGDPVSGASYSFLDTPGYGTFYYQLEDVDLYGVSTLHGPVEVTMARPFRRPLYRPLPPVFPLILVGMGASGFVMIQHKKRRV